MFWEEKRLSLCKVCVCVCKRVCAMWSSGSGKLCEIVYIYRSLIKMFVYLYQYIMDLVLLFHVQGIWGLQICI